MKNPFIIILAVLFLFITNCSQEGKMDSKEISLVIDSRKDC